MVCKGHFQWFFRLNPCQVLLSFRAVQVKQLAFLASFLSDLFRRLATLSCRVLIVTWLCSESRWATWEGWKQPMISFRPNTCWFPRESSMIFFPLLCLMIGGYFHSDFSVRTMIIQRCLGWHLLLEAPLLLPQAMEMDRDPMSITACTSPHHLNHEFLS